MYEKMGEIFPHHTISRTGVLNSMLISPQPFCVEVTEEQSILDMVSCFG
jgi:hypothetical protein